MRCGRAAAARGMSAVTSRLDTVAARARAAGGIAGDPAAVHAAADDKDVGVGLA